MQKLLLLHGALGSSSNFSELEKMLELDFKVHTFTFEGHGERELPESLSIPKFAAEVIRFLDENAIDKISIFGYSMGGYVGLYLAKYFPERVQKLYTLATKLNWTKEGAIKESAMLNPELIKEKVPKYALALSQMHGENWKKLLTKTAEMMIDLGNQPQLTDEDFEKIEIPIRISVGDKDTMVTIEESLNAYRKLPNAQFHIMPNTSHPIERVDMGELAHQIRGYF
ncbi:MAG: alpha/beta hydrolase [Bacteroidota bacterium]